MNAGMEVTVRRTGGFAGLAREGSAELDAGAVTALASGLDAAAAAGPGPTRDGFTYTVTAGGRRWTAGEAALGQETKATLEAVLRDA